MDYQLLLNLILMIMVIALSVLLFLRIRKQKNQLSTIAKMKLDRFTDFLLTNARDGSIVEVAKRMSDLLVNAFECRYIIFLRKKKGALDLNYYHGIRGFKPQDFHLKYSSKFDEILKTDYLPKPISLLDKYLSKDFKKQIERFEIDTFFPIFWRENLYGIYFIKSTAHTGSRSFVVLLAALAQSLSAAYHIKWHESRTEKLLQKPVTIKTTTVEAGENVSRILKLVQNRKSSTIISGILDTLKEMTGMKNVVYFYTAENKTDMPMLFKNGNLDSPNVPDREIFTRVTDILKDNKLLDLKSWSYGKDTELDSWVDSLKVDGLNYIASFPLTKDRPGILSWTGGNGLNDLSKQLEAFRDYNETLFENAESFEKIEELSYTDNLTRLSNQRYFFKRLDEEMDRAKRYNRKLALLIFDVDELKNVNDHYGHLAGDGLISQIATILRKSIRTIDVVARYGGDEFCIIMPETDQKTCLTFMNRIRSKIQSTDFVLENVQKPVSSSLSMGAAIFPDHAVVSKDLIYLADMALLKAKESGRNRYFICETSLH